MLYRRFPYESVKDKVFRLNAWYKKKTGRPLTWGADMFKHR
jgi:hypothetical protein